MKRHFVGAAALGAILFAQGVSAYMITDSYVGSNDHGYGDVIGDSSKFEIFGADVSLAGTILNGGHLHQLCRSGRRQAFQQLHQHTCE